MDERIVSKDIEEKILQVLKKGNTVEIKKERDNLVFVEIQRKVFKKQEY